jgi:hypothetical protein
MSKGGLSGPPFFFFWARDFDRSRMAKCVASMLNIQSAVAEIE